jgi:predicted Zn-dependent protease
MKTRLRPAWFAFPIILVVVVIACGTVPITGRTQFDIIPNGTMLGLASQQYRDFIHSHHLSNDVVATQMVKRVGQNIRHGVEHYLTQHGMGDRLHGYQWEFNLIESKDVNAWCMPGGKVVVYTGLLKVTRDESGMAVVLGHEIAHAVANHAGERMSQELLAEMGGVALAVALSQKPAETQILAMAAYGAGAEVGFLLPYSRLHESEADHLGLIFMAIAGYDPHRAIQLWKDMEKLSHTPDALNFLSTHPTNAERVKAIEHFVPEAMRYYQGPKA